MTEVIDQPGGTPSPAPRVHTRHGAARFLAGRLGEYGVVLAVALTLNFALPRMLPGGPLRAIGGENVGNLSPEAREKIFEQYNLNDSLGGQFLDYLRGVFTLDLGTSFSDGRSVTAAIAEALPWTLLLVGASLVFTSVIGILLGVVAALRRQRGKGSGLLSTVLMLDSMPAFWLGMLFIFFFGVYLGVLPTFGVAGAGGAGAGLGTMVSHLVLPVLTLVLTGLGQFFLVSRYSMLSVLSAEPIEHAHARGVPRGKLIRRHALRPSLLPVHTVLLMEVGALVGGALVVETVFAYPGLGRLTFEAVQGRDYPMMQGTFLVLTVTVIVMNAVADATYPLLDPRVRTRGEA